jgi:hypothetical protein
MDHRTVTQRPYAGMALDGEGIVNDNRASLIFLYGEGLQ